MSSLRLTWILAVVIAAVTALFARPAAAIDRNFAGSAMVDYHYAPSNEIPRSTAFDGLTTELSLKAAIDVSDKFSATVKVCYGCHGFEVPMAQLEYRFGQALSLRAGRFSPSLGAFPLRYDPANHRLSTKPLIYDMGRMLRMREWNMGVVPSPFPDNGVELSGTKWFGETVQFDYAAYVVSGFKSDSQGFDLDWQRSRSGEAYYVDNNHRPAYGGRLVLTTKLGERSDLTFGISGQHGTSDPARNLDYTFFGADIALRIKSTNIRLEYLGRRQKFDTTDPTLLAYSLASTRNDFFIKQGAYAEMETTLTGPLDFILRYDLLARAGNLPAGSLLSKRSSIHRATVGITYMIERGLRVKASTEGWRFSDPDSENKHYAIGFHLGLVGTY